MITQSGEAMETMYPKSRARALAVLFVWVALFVVACGANTDTESRPLHTRQAGDEPQLPFSLKEVSKSSGINFQHTSAHFDSKLDNLMPWIAGLGASVAAGDFENTGCVGLYVTNTGVGSKNALYRNNCDGTFTDIAEKVGLAGENSTEQGVSVAASWADYDNHGCSSLYISKWGWSKLYQNDCKGHFTDVTEKAGLKYWGYPVKAIWTDFNKDGCLDLYVATYYRPEINLFKLDSTKIMFNDWQRARNAAPNLLYRNNCNGTFTEVAREYGVDDTGWSLAVGASDFNGDGWPDLYVANDVGPDSLFINEAGKGFRNAKVTRGIGSDTSKGMNVDVGDYNNDGRPDIYVTNITKPGYLIEGNMLWRNDGNGNFTNVAHDIGVAACGWGWGAKFVDIDNSGHQSIYSVNGFISAGKGDYWFDLGTMGSTPNFVIEDTNNWARMRDRSMSGHERKCLFMDNGQGKFKDVATLAGLTDTYDGRGVAVIDFNNDGAPDLAVANQNGPLLLYQNSGLPGRHWLQFKLIGSSPSNRDAIDAQITVTAGGKPQHRWRDGGLGFAAQSDPRIMFGLGDTAVVDEVKIHWPSGHVDTLTNLAADRLYVITEGQGINGSK